MDHTLTVSVASSSQSQNTESYLPLHDLGLPLQHRTSQLMYPEDMYDPGMSPLPPPHHQGSLSPNGYILVVYQNYEPELCTVIIAQSGNKYIKLHQNTLQLGLQIMIKVTFNIIFL